MFFFLNVNIILFRINKFENKISIGNIQDEPNHLALHFNLKIKKQTKYKINSLFITSNIFN